MTGKVLRILLRVIAYGISTIICSYIVFFILSMDLAAKYPNAEYGSPIVTKLGYLSFVAGVLLNIGAFLLAQLYFRWRDKRAEKQKPAS
ncbi:MAG: hypothetical protein KGI60_01740 [Patescibacteria group bacterium]|nr:hypothetical protein [Patescibacteria group bacterium]